MYSLKNLSQPKHFKRCVRDNTCVLSHRRLQLVFRCEKFLLGIELNHVELFSPTLTEVTEGIFQIFCQHCSA